MVKLRHLLILSVLVAFLLGSGCTEKETSNAGLLKENTPIDISNSEYKDVAVTDAEIMELDSDMTELESFLEDTSLEEEIVIEEL